MIHSPPRVQKAEDTNQLKEQKILRVVFREVQVEGATGSHGLFSMLFPSVL